MVPDEEVGGALSQAAVRRWGEAARALWVLEPGEPAEAAGEAETLVAGRRGMFQWRLEVSGRGAHSGLHYWDGRSALTAAARWVAEAQALSTPDGGPTVNAGRFVAGDSTFVDALATAHALLGTDRQLNVVPDRAIVEGEARFLRAAEGQDLARRLEALAWDTGVATGTEISFAASLFIPPVDPRVPTAPSAGAPSPSPPPPAGAWRSRRSAVASPSPTSSPTPTASPSSTAWGRSEGGCTRGRNTWSCARCAGGSCCWRIFWRRTSTKPDCPEHP